MKTIPPEVAISCSALFVAVHRLEILLKETSQRMNTGDPSDIELLKMLEPNRHESLGVAFNALETIAKCNIGYLSGNDAAFEKLKAGPLQPGKEAA